MDAIEKIRRRFSSTCVVSCLRRGNCSVGLSGIPKPRLVIDLDLPGSPLDEQSVRCDYLVFAGDGKRQFLVAPVEFKTTWRIKAAKQLQAGSDESHHHAPAAPAVTFRPVVAVRRFGRKMERRRMRAKRVRFRGRWEPIRVVRCGETLDKVLEA